MQFQLFSKRMFSIPIQFFQHGNLMKGAVFQGVNYCLQSSIFSLQKSLFAADAVAKEEDELNQLIRQQLDQMRVNGTYKSERYITSPQNSTISVQGREQSILNFCANNYLGLSDHPKLIEAAKKALDEKGYGLSSVRFICGTQDIHNELEGRISSFHGTDDTILYASCFDANAGLFEALLSAEDAIISDQLNHASIIDGIRLCKAQRFRYNHLDMSDLEQKLQDASNARIKAVVTDGVFSMDGDIAPIKEICDICERYGALVIVDDSHATGFVGEHGRGTAEYWGVEDKVDIINTTLGKALGGATGGYTTGRGDVIELLRQKSRPYLFSNTLAPPVVAAALKVFDLLQETSDLITQLNHNTKYFREKMTAAGFNIRPGTHAIVPVMLGDARVASKMADMMLERGVYVVGFSYPVVPKDQARIRVQLSAAHTQQQLDFAIQQFKEVGRELGVLC
eukprot:TRINITY_DN1379_c1_g2_i2.p1 TRINITY_DN1379_c1_g2~~TRINITY_DN1379_c1_g2_i2.p1  ORF type:complete len:453 (+),score=69.62 TRINITY_DN1379_c1_g2_i2:29-1387(+)